MTKFNVGDKVKVTLADSQTGKKYEGKSFVINRIKACGHYELKYASNGTVINRCWNDSEIDTTVPKPTIKEPTRDFRCKEYKIGDKVVVAEDSSKAGLYMNAEMNALFGKTVTIEKINTEGYYKVSGSEWSWTDGMFSGIASDVAPQKAHTMKTAPKLKFGVGDKVRVRSGLGTDRSYGGVFANPDMTQMFGKILTIKRANVTDYRVDENGWYWTDEMLEEVKEEPIEAIRLAYVKFHDTDGKGYLFTTTTDLKKGEKVFVESRTTSTGMAPATTISDSFLVAPDSAKILLEMATDKRDTFAKVIGYRKEVTVTKCEPFSKQSNKISDIKVGDKLLVKKDLIEHRMYGGDNTTLQMLKLRGTIVTVTGKNSDGSIMSIAEDSYNWTPQMLTTLDGQDLVE